MSKSKNVAYVLLYFSFSCNPPGYMRLNNFENLSSLFIAQKTSMNRLAALYSYGPVDFLEIRF